MSSKRRQSPNLTQQRFGAAWVPRALRRIAWTALLFAIGIVVADCGSTQTPEIVPAPRFEPPPADLSGPVRWEPPEDGPGLQQRHNGLWVPTPLDNYLADTIERCEGVSEWQAAEIGRREKAWAQSLGDANKQILDLGEVLAEHEAAPSWWSAGMIGLAVGVGVGVLVGALAVGGASL